MRQIQYETHSISHPSEQTYTAIKVPVRHMSVETQKRVGVAADLEVSDVVIGEEAIEDVLSLPGQYDAASTSAINHLMINAYQIDLWAVEGLRWHSRRRHVTARVAAGIHVLAEGHAPKGLAVRDACVHGFSRWRAVEVWYAVLSHGLGCGLS